MNTLFAVISIANALSAPLSPIKEVPLAAPEPIMMNVIATAYSPRVQETDATPFITAFGTRTRNGIIAANFLPFGTTVRFPDLFGDKIFTVEDRMNRRYTHSYPHRIDMAFEKTKDAIRFGRQAITMEIVEMGKPFGAAQGKLKTAEDISLRPLKSPAS